MTSFRPEIADSGRERKEAFVPPRGLPGNANLEQLKKGAKSTSPVFDKLYTEAMKK